MDFDKFNVRHDEWGSNFDESIVAGLHRNNGGLIDPEKQYSELYIDKSQESFVFKILSVKKPIVTEYCETSKIIVAITEFEILCGFVTDTEYLANMFEYPALKNSFGDATTVHAAVHNLSSRSDEDTINTVNELLQSKLPQNHIFRRTVTLYSFLLNYVRLQANEAIYIPKHELCSYVSGDIVECSSKIVNNTNKLASRQGLPIFFRGSKKNKHVVTYDVSDTFKIHKLYIRSNELSSFTTTNSTILMVTAGEGNIDNTYFKKGNAMYINSTTHFKVFAQTDMQIWLATSVTR